MTEQDPRRSLPGVDRVLASPPFQDLLKRVPRARVVAVLRRALAEARRAPEGAPATVETWLTRVTALLDQEGEGRLVPVINATGVVLHTNLGRAILSEAARDRLAGLGASYSNLEFDLVSGGRGSRAAHVERLLCRLTGAEAALVVNNAAGALVLALAAVARGAPVVVSRGELVEIGGGFRIPEVVEAAGPRLREVGTTNRTRLKDYERALRRGRVGALLKVHQSNFRITGFTEEVGLRELVDLGRRFGVPVVYDLGTGAMVDLEMAGLPSEPTAPTSVAHGPALVVFSGDKLLGGPQAGVLVGWREALGAAARHPLARALRADKLTLGALTATLAAYERGTAWEELPVLRMLRADPDRLRQRSVTLAESLRHLGHDTRVAETVSVVGGGSLPGAELDSWGVQLEGGTPLAQRLRNGHPAVIARIESERVILDLRTVPEAHDETLQGAIHAALSGLTASG